MIILAVFSQKQMNETDKKLKVCLLGATFSTSNMGVGALTEGTIQSVIHQFPDAEIILLDYGTEGLTYNIQIDKRNVPIQLINMRFSKKVYLKNNIALLIFLSLVLKLIPFQKIKNKLISNNFYLNQIFESDIVASIAGGDSFSDIYGLRRYLYVSLPQLLVLSLGKKLILLPQTLGPFNLKLTSIIARYILNRARIIYSRDYTGLRETKALLEYDGNPEKLRFCYDVGFVVNPVRPGKIDLGGLREQSEVKAPLIGLNVSGLLYMGGYTENNMFGLRIDYRKFVNDLIDFLIQKKNANIILIPHVFGSQEHKESDSVVSEIIFNSLHSKYKDRIFVARGNYNQNEIKYIIGLCDFFIGSRMHACIAALSQNIPAVAIAYSKKFYGVMETIGVEFLVADPRKMEKEEILNMISETYSQRDLIRKQLEQKIPEVKRTVLNLFNEIEMYS